MVKLFRKNSNLSQSSNVTDDRRTEGQTTCDRKTVLYTKVHRAVKTIKQLKKLLDYIRQAKNMKNGGKNSVAYKLFGLEP